MSSNAEKLPGEPIILRILGADMQSEEEFTAGMAADLALVEKQVEPVFLIIDMTNSPLAAAQSLDIVAVVANIAARQMKLFRHPKVRQVVFVTTSPMLQQVAKGLDSEIYGNIKTKVWATIDEALAYARNTK